MALRKGISKHSRSRRGVPPSPRYSLILALIVLMLGYVPFVYAGYYEDEGFEKGDRLYITVSKLTSPYNKLAYDYRSLPFCELEPKPASSSGSYPRSSSSFVSNLGQLLMGEREMLTAYEINMLENVQCKMLCTRQVDAKERKRLRRRISQAYRMRLFLDGMPVVHRVTHDGRGNSPSSSPELSTVPTVQIGIPIGEAFPNDNRSSIQRMIVYNHISFKIMYHKVDRLSYVDLYALSQDLGSSIESPQSTKADIQSKPEPSHPFLYRIVGFEAEIYSIEHPSSVANAETMPDCRKEAYPGRGPTDIVKPRFIEEDDDKPFTVSYSYDIQFEQSELSWATRWDPYVAISKQQKQSHWLSITHSTILVGVLFGLIALFLLRMIRKDFLASYSIWDDAFDEAGWKGLHGDVFRMPPYALWLSVCTGTGAQLVVAVFCTLFGALLGLAAPEKRGALLSALIVSWALSSFVSGFVSTRMHIIFGRMDWKLACTATSLAFPIFVFMIFFGINIMLWISGSISAAPILVQIVLLMTWLFVSIPLVFLGGFLSARGKRYDFVVRSNQLVREIPPQRWYLGTFLTVASSLAPFGVICVELHFILASIWQSHFYHVFGILFIVYILLLLVCAETSITVVYLKLSGEDHAWWWPSFYSVAMSSVWVFFYSLHFLFVSDVRKKLNVLSMIMYLGYMLIISVTFGLLTGSAGLLASLWFVRAIFRKMHQ